ncbi:MAG: hypothetical protein LBC33_00895, partial [Mycoplasmataceae bacterium]|nr:hypothetical protein [Mycoplasmataceae bacterium]
NSTFDVFNIGEAGNHYDQVKMLDNADDAVVEQNGILTVKFPNYEFPTLPELRTDADYYLTYNTSEIIEFFSADAWPNPTNNLLTNENKKAICDSQYQITGKNIDVIERGKDGYRIIIQNPNDYNYTITFKQNASFNLYDVKLTSSQYDNNFFADDERIYTFTWDKYPLTTDYRVYDHLTQEEEDFDDKNPFGGNTDYRNANKTVFDQWTSGGSTWESIDLKGGKLAADVIEDTSSSIQETKFSAFGSIIPLEEIDTFGKVKWNDQTEYQTYVNGFIPNRQLSLQIRERPNEDNDPELFGQQLYYQWIIENNNYTNNAAKFVSKVNVDHSIGEPLELQLSFEEMLHNNEVYKKRIEELLQSKLIDRTQFDRYFTDNIIYHSLKIATVGADIIVTALDLAATICSFGATVWSWITAGLVALGDFIDVGIHFIEISSLYAQRDNLDHHLKSDEYKSIIELCKWIGAEDDQYQAVNLNDLELVEADVVDENTETASKLNFKDKYNQIVNELNLIADAENVDLNDAGGEFNEIFDGVAEGLKALAGGLDGTFTKDKFNKASGFVSMTRALMKDVNLLIGNYCDNVWFSWFFNLLSGPVFDFISQIFTINKFAHQIKILRQANSVTNCRIMGKTLNAKLNTTLFKNTGFWYDKKPDKLGRRIKNRPHLKFKPDLARKLLVAAIIFGIIVTITDLVTDIWYETGCQKDYVLTCNWEQWKKQNIAHASR